MVKASCKASLARYSSDLGTDPMVRWNSLVREHLSWTKWTLSQRDDLFSKEFHHLLSCSWGKCKKQRWNSIVWLWSQRARAKQCTRRWQNPRGRHSHCHLHLELCRTHPAPRTGQPWQLPEMAPIGIAKMSLEYISLVRELELTS